jgi:hypothetical protein
VDCGGHMNSLEWKVKRLNDLKEQYKIEIVRNPGSHYVEHLLNLITDLHEEILIGEPKE